MRWFIIITYGEDTQLFHSIHGLVGSVCTGVKQGDPLSMLFFAVAIQPALDEIDEDIMNLHPGSDTARAGAFADDGVVVGDALKLLDRYSHPLRSLPESPTSTYVQMDKNVLEVSGVAGSTL